MINRTIFKKTLGESLPMIAAASLGITGFVVLFAQSMLGMGAELMKFVSQFEFLQKIFEFGFGIDVSGEISISVLFAVCFTHGLVLIMSWSTVIATTSRVTSGEVERGTADLLLTLPVTRAEVYCSTSLVWISASALLAICPVIGVWIGLQIFEIDEPVEITRYFAPALNFFFLILAVGGISSMVSAIVDRRGMAVSIVAGFLLLSSVLNFVLPFIEAIQPLSFLGILGYFRPVDIVRSGNWPISEMATLFAIAAVCWTIGLVVFSRKDIPTA
jgi:ABC-2 type transport system permease protein